MENCCRTTVLGSNGCQCKTKQNGPTHNLLLTASTHHLAWCISYATEMNILNSEFSLSMFICSYLSTKIHDSSSSEDDEDEEEDVAYFPGNVTDDFFLFLLFCWIPPNVPCRLLILYLGEDVVDEDDVIFGDKLRCFRCLCRSCCCWWDDDAAAAAKDGIKDVSWLA